MLVIKNDVRYELLVDEFRLPREKSAFYSKELMSSLELIFSYVYNFTDVYYIDSIDEELLYSYIKHHGKRNFKEVSFIKATKDIKNFLYFLNNIKGLKNVPKVNLSINNISLWSKL